MSSDETYPLTLGGRTWELPAMPFRIVKKAQPRLLALGAVVIRVADPQSPGAVSEAELDEFASVAYLLIGYVEKDLTLADFLELPFTVNELILAFPSIARAIGLRSNAPATEGAAPEGKSTGTA